MIRWGIALAAIAVIAWPQLTAAQVCRRVCRAGEVRDANRCCVPKGSVRRRSTGGTLRFEADVRRARIKVGPRTFNSRLPANLRNIPAGNHSVVVRTGKKVWRGAVKIVKGKTARLFASINGGEWTPGAAKQTRARAILDAALKAKGGAARLRKLKSIQYWGKTSPDGALWPGAWHMAHWVKPGKTHWKVVMTVGGQKGEVTMATTPLKRWVASHTKYSLQVTPSLSQQQDLDYLWHWPDRILLRHTERGTRVALLPATTIDGAAVDVVQIARADGTGRVRLYLHRATRMLLRFERIDPRGHFDTPAVFSDYRRLGPYKFAYRWSYARLTADWTRISLDQTIAKNLFVPPKPRSYRRGRAAPGFMRVREKLDVRSIQPHLARLNGDTVTDFYAKCYYDRSEFKPNGKRVRTKGHYVCGFDGSTFKLLWRIGPFKRNFKLSPAISGRMLVVYQLRPGRSIAEVYQLRYRRRMQRFLVSDRVKRLCVEPRGTRVWLDVVDGNRRSIDLRALINRADKSARWCVRTPSGCQRAERNARCATSLEYRKFQKVPGFRLSYALNTKAGRVAFGYKHPGTALPMLVSYTRGGKLRWKKRIVADAANTYVPTSSDVVAGTIYIGYNRRRYSMLVAISERTGGVLWRTRLPLPRAGIGPMRATRDRIYVTSRWLDTVAIVDAGTGKVLGHVGYADKRSSKAIPKGAR